MHMLGLLTKDKERRKKIYILRVTKSDKSTIISVHNSLKRKIWLAIETFSNTTTYLLLSFKLTQVEDIVFM